ncbi:unnamed protein product [Durusdinium trenchii]|uniref:Uncharacterized protein n=1 Tax=Durusdinium trenchii TaxID=1381693 RepID=A0ABP0RWH1_9DINO
MAVTRSYRSLVEALQNKEALVAQLESEAQEARQQSKSLREEVLSEALLYGATEENACFSVGAVYEYSCWLYRGISSDSKRGVLAGMPWTSFRTQFRSFS